MAGFDHDRRPILQPLLPANHDGIPGVHATANFRDARLANAETDLAAGRLPVTMTKTKLLPWMGTMASSGTTVAFGRTSAASRRSTYIPACSDRFGLGTSALTVMVRPGEPDHRVHKVHHADEFLAGQRRHVEGDLLAAAEPLGVALRHLEGRALRVDGLE